MQDADKILEALRPAHLPPVSAAISFADLALPVAIGLLFALLVALVWPRRIKGRRRMARRALDELRRARALPPEEARLAQARLLRRVVERRDGAAAAGLSGAAFAAHLDRSFATDFFSKGPGRSLTLSLYEPANGNAPQAKQEADEVASGLERLFVKLRA